MSDNFIFLRFCAFLDFFKIHWCFVDYRVRFYIREVFFLEEWFFGFAKSYFSGIFRIFIGLFELDMLL